MRMLRLVAWIVVIAASAGIANAGGGTALTYQGRLLDAGEPANGTFNVDFSLWDDPSAGSQVGSTIMFSSLPISDGLFTVELDFGANAFNNTDRWLAISVDGVPLMPRQPITRAPYSIQTRGIYVDADEHVGIGTTSPVGKAEPLRTVAALRLGSARHSFRCGLSVRPFDSVWHGHRRIWPIARLCRQHSTDRPTRHQPSRRFGPN